MTTDTISHEDATHRAIGWLVAAVNCEHATLIATEAARARAAGHSEIAAVLDSWKRPGSDMDALGALFASTLPNPDDEDDCESQMEHLR